MCSPGDLYIPAKVPGAERPTVVCPQGALVIVLSGFIPSAKGVGAHLALSGVEVECVASAAGYIPGIVMLTGFGEVK